MRVLEAKRKPVDTKALKFKTADILDFDNLVECSLDVMVEGQLAVAFRVLDALPPGLADAAGSIEYQETARTDGLVTQSRTVGSLPRVTLRRDFCTQSSLDRQHPKEAAAFRAAADDASVKFMLANPALWAKQQEAVSAVLPEWRMNPVFTSGIVNKNNSLRYHKDSGNFHGLWSAMYAWTFDVTGGVLSVPELGLGFSFERPALILFNGADLIHAVTPIVRRSSMSYRYSVVFYAMKQLCNCLSLAGELARIRTVKTERETKRLARKGS